MFVNCSNHKSDNWGERQIQEAEKWGEIVDFPFPNVDPKADEKAIQELAAKTAEQLLEIKPDAVMCQGEFSLTFSLVKILRENGIPVFSACSYRSAVEEHLPNGRVEKKAVFEFVRFRRYE